MALEDSTAPVLTHGHLLSILRYDPESGVFTRLRRSDRSQRWNTRYAGKVAGWIENGTGRRRISIDKAKYLDSLLAWFYVTSEWPSEEVDHRDVDALNCKWDNLRLATRSQNGANKKTQSNNTSGYKGVTWQAKDRKWYAKITVNYRQINLGFFDSAEEAYAAYCAAAHKYFGEFARAE